MIRLASVAVPVPLVERLTYRVPDALEVPSVGARVLVPLGTRSVTGCVLAVETVQDDDARARGGELRDILDVLDGDAYVPAGVLALAAWVAEYYACGPGEAIAAAVPPFAWVESRRVVALTDDARQTGSRRRGGRRFRQEQQAALAAIGAAGSVPVSTLRTRLGKHTARTPACPSSRSSAPSSGEDGSASARCSTASA